MVVTVTYEGVPIVRGAAAKPLTGGEIFVSCEAPMPVWTSLTVELDGGKPQSAQVIAIEEDAGQGGASISAGRFGQPGMLLCIGDITQVATPEPEGSKRAQDGGGADVVAAAPVSSVSTEERASRIPGPGAPTQRPPSNKSKRKKRR